MIHDFHIQTAKQKPDAGLPNYFRSLGHDASRRQSRKVSFEILTIAAGGNRVLTERLDKFERADGSEIGATKVMGILELGGD